MTWLYHHSRWVAQSVYRLTTGWTVRGSNPSKGEIFRTCPDRPWGPPIVLYNRYRVFPGGKERPGSNADPSLPSSAVVMTEQSYTSAPCMGRTACTEPQCLYKGALYLYHSGYRVGGVVFHIVTLMSHFFFFCFSIRILFHSTQQPFRQPCVVLCNIRYSLRCQCGVCFQMSDSQLQRSFRSSFTESYRCLASRADEFCIHFSDSIPIRVFIRLTFLNYLGCSFFVIV